MKNVSRKVSQGMLEASKPQGLNKGVYRILKAGWREEGGEGSLLDAQLRVHATSLGPRGTCQPDAPVALPSSDGSVTGALCRCHVQVNQVPGSEKSQWPSQLFLRTKKFASQPGTGPAKDSGALARGHSGASSRAEDMQFLKGSFISPSLLPRDPVLHMQKRSKLRALYIDLFLPQEQRT